MTENLLASALALLISFQGCSKLISFENGALLKREANETVALNKPVLFRISEKHV
jgi:hypothetical protein